MKTFPAMPHRPQPCPACGAETIGLGRRICDACYGSAYVPALAQPVVRGRRVEVDGLMRTEHDR